MWAISRIYCDSFAAKAAIGFGMVAAAAGSGYRDDPNRFSPKLMPLLYTIYVQLHFYCAPYIQKLLLFPILCDLRHENTKRSAHTSCQGRQLSLHYTNSLAIKIQNILKKKVKQHKIEKYLSCKNNRDFIVPQKFHISISYKYEQT